MQIRDQHVVQLQQHALLISEGLFEKATNIFESRALPGLSALAVKSTKELALARSFPGPISARFLETFTSALETLIFVVKMAAEGTASAVIKHCPLLAQALRQLKVLPEMEDASGGVNDSDAVRTVSWVVPVQVRCTEESPMVFTVSMPPLSLHSHQRYHTLVGCVFKAGSIWPVSKRYRY